MTDIKRINGAFTFKSKNPYFTKQLLEKEYFENELSSNKIGDKYSCSKKYVINSFKKLGIKMRTAGETRRLHYKNGGIHPMTGTGKIIDYKGYLAKSINGKYKSIHQINWMNANGFWYIPAGMHIHHVDRNKQNNDPNNLVMLPKAIHCSLHAKLRILENEDNKYFGKNQHLRGTI